MRTIREVAAQHGRIVSAVPVELLEKAARCKFDGFEQAVQGIADWRCALLAGALPAGGRAWPEGPLGRAVMDSFPRALLRFTRGNDEVAQSVISDLLDILEGVRASWDTAAADELEKWLEEERKRREAAAAEGSDAASPSAGGPSKRQPKQVSQAEIVARRADELAKAESSLEGWCAEGMATAWGERIDGWIRIGDVFGALESHMSFGFDLQKAFFRHVGWAQVERMHSLLKSLPQIAEIAKALGRAKMTEDVGPAETILEKVSRVREELQWVEAPDARTHTDGIYKSDDIPRMLPMEGSLYLHPVFRKLWRAKFIERSLACYEIKGIARRSVLVSEIVEQKRTVCRRMDRGPIIICLDTSGSMQGVPETVAKAITLEAMRLAHAEKRACYLYAFSGTGSVKEHELDLSPKGIEGLCGFLGMSFHGGTDVAGPLLSACKHMEKEAWGRADIILVSDGLFEVPDEAQQVLKAAKAKLGLRIHGLVISNTRDNSHEMSAICDPMHHFSDWSAVRGLA